MSSLKAVRNQIVLQQPSEIYTLGVAADRAASSGSREVCIDLVKRMYCLLDWAHAQGSDQDLHCPADLSFLLQ